MTRQSVLVASCRVAALALAAGLAACGGGEPDRRAAVEIRGTNPAAGPAGTGPAAGAPVAASPSASVPVAPVQDAVPGAGGVIDYGSYQAVVARQGDTVADLASRIGLSASELAAYNGLTPSHSLRAGDELVLPGRPGGYAADTAVASAPPAASPSGLAGDPVSGGAIETTPLAGAGEQTLASAEPAAAPVETAPAPAARASDESWSPDLAAAAIERSSGLNADGTLAAPPSAAQPVPPEPPARQELASPDLGQYQTGATGTTAPPPAATADVASAAGIEPAAAPVPNVRMLRPVEGPVAIGFNKGAGPARNDGVDFAAAAGAQVVAAADGEVALVSQALGGLGTIVLLRHPDGLLTVYGRIDDVTVQKGDTVRAGQAIGVVSSAAAPDEPRMHFEVRRGAESLDPMQFL